MVTVGVIRVIIKYNVQSINNIYNKILLYNESTEGIVLQTTL